MTRAHEAKPIRCDQPGCYARATRGRAEGSPDQHRVCAHHMRQGGEPGHWWYGTLPAVCRVCGEAIQPHRATFWRHVAPPTYPGEGRGR